MSSNLKAYTCCWHGCNELGVPKGKLERIQAFAKLQQEHDGENGACVLGDACT